MPWKIFMNNVLVNKKNRKETENKMTNFEKYKNDILKVANENCCSPAKKNEVIIPCSKVKCKECDFGDMSNCSKNCFNWLYEDDGEEHDGCDGCKYEYKRENESPCTECCNNYMSKWERKPKKTRQDEFLERYPNVRKCYGVVDICPKDLDMHFYCRSQDLLSEGCKTCCQEYWLQEVEE